VKRVNVRKNWRTWVNVVVVIVIILLIAFPGRRMAREEQFRNSLAQIMEIRGQNTEHISVCLESMCELIDTALDTEDQYDARTNLSALSAWADDCADSLGQINDYFNAYINTKDRSYIGQFTTGSYEIRDGCLKLSAWLIPYITGERDMDEPFRETLLGVKEDLQWLGGLWTDAFDGELSEQAFIAAYHGLLYDHEPEFNQFLIEIHQALNEY